MGQFEFPIKQMDLLSEIELPREQEQSPARAIQQCLIYLQWEAHAAGYDFLSKLIGAAAEEAQDIEEDERW